MRTAEGLGVQHVHVIESVSEFTLPAAEASVASRGFNSRTVAQTAAGSVAMGASRWLTLSKYRRSIDCYEALREAGCRIVASDCPPATEDEGQESGASFQTIKQHEFDAKPIDALSFEARNPSPSSSATSAAASRASLSSAPTTPSTCRWAASRSRSTSRWRARWRSTPRSPLAPSLRGRSPRPSATSCWRSGCSATSRRRARSCGRRGSSWTTLSGRVREAKISSALGSVRATTSTSRGTVGGPLGAAVTPASPRRHRLRCTRSTPRTTRSSASRRCSRRATSRARSRPAGGATPTCTRSSAASATPTSGRCSWTRVAAISASTSRTRRAPPS